jgi:hypothetical protein
MGERVVAGTASAGADGRAAASGEARFERGLKLGGYIYGTILTLSVIVAGARGFPHSPTHIAVVVAITSLVFWIAHVYSHALGHSVAHEERISFPELKAIARRESAMIQAAVPPVVALLLGAVGLVRESVAIWAAFGVGLVILGAQGVVVARIERLGLLATAVVVAANLALGLVLVALKLLTSH